MFDVIDLLYLLKQQNTSGFTPVPDSVAPKRSEWCAVGDRRHLLQGAWRRVAVFSSARVLVLAL